MQLCSASALIVASLLFCPSAFAATVKPVQGDVLVNRGNGYEHVSGPTHARVGDTVMVSPGGVAEIIYPDGCAVTVRPGSVRAVKTRSFCKTAAAIAETRMGAGVGDGDWSTHVEPAHEGLHNWAIFVLPGAAAIVGLYFLLDADDKSASP